MLIFPRALLEKKPRTRGRTRMVLFIGLGEWVAWKRDGQRGEVQRVERGFLREVAVFQRNSDGVFS